MIIIWAGVVGSVGAGPAQVARVLHDYAVIFGTEFRKWTHYSYIYIRIYMIIIQLPSAAPPPCQDNANGI